jgi:hypothetical protein
MTDEPWTEKTCILCDGSGKMHPLPEQPHAETVRRAVSLITLALDHEIRDDDHAFTEEELMAVLGDMPLQHSLSQMSMVASVTAAVLRQSTDSDDAARAWWSRISQWLLNVEDAE